jgi:hypothetical protein
MARLEPVNPDTVAHLMAFRWPAVAPTYADRVAACRALAAEAYTDGQIAVALRCAVRSVIRIRRQHGIAGQAVGVNGRTRRHELPTPVPARWAARNHHARKNLA